MKQIILFLTIVAFLCPHIALSETNLSLFEVLNNLEKEKANQQQELAKVSKPKQTVMQNPNIEPQANQTKSKIENYNKFVEDYRKFLGQISPKNQADEDITQLDEFVVTGTRLTEKSVRDMIKNAKCKVTYNYNFLGRRISEKYRKCNLDLSGMDVSGMDLSHLNLSGMDMRFVNAEGTDFSGSIMEWTDFRCANLRSANMGGTSFSWADFRGAKIQISKKSFRNIEGSYTDSPQFTTDQLHVLWYWRRGSVSFNLAETDYFKMDHDVYRTTNLGVVGVYVKPSRTGATLIYQTNAIIDENFNKNTDCAKRKHPRGQKIISLAMLKCDDIISVSRRSAKMTCKEETNVGSWATMLEYEYGICFPKAIYLDSQGNERACRYRSAKEGLPLDHDVPWKVEPVEDKDEWITNARTP